MNSKQRMPDGATNSAVRCPSPENRSRIVRVRVQAFADISAGQVDRREYSTSSGPGSSLSTKRMSSGAAFFASPVRTASWILPMDNRIAASSSAPSTGPSRASGKVLPWRETEANRKSPSGPAAPLIFQKCEEMCQVAKITGGERSDDLDHGGAVA